MVKREAREGGMRRGGGERGKGPWIGTIISPGRFNPFKISPCHKLSATTRTTWITAPTFEEKKRKEKKEAGGREGEEKRREEKNGESTFITKPRGGEREEGVGAGGECATVGADR